MKLRNIKDAEAFCKVINSCKGEIQLVSPEGDSLNLKSKLIQYVALSKYFGETQLKSLDLRVENEEDKAKIYQFMLGSVL